MTDTPAPAIDTTPAPANTAPVDAGPVDPAVIDPTALEASAATPDAPASTLDAVIGFLDVGGPVLWLLGILSVVTLALILAKFLQFSTARLNGRKGRAPLAAIATATTEAYSATGADRALAADAGRRLARRIMQPLEGGLATLGMIAMLSPLIGLLGTICGDNGVNIANFQLGRNRPGGDAIALLYVDDPVPEHVLDKVRGFPEILSAKPLMFDV